MEKPTKQNRFLLAKLFGLFSALGAAGGAAIGGGFALANDFESYTLSVAVGAVLGAGAAGFYVGKITDDEVTKG